MTSDDPAAEDDRPVLRTRTVDVGVSLLIGAFAALMAWDNSRTGARWASDGPEVGYFPFYLSLLLGGAALAGLVSALSDRDRAGGTPFVTRDQFRRVARVFVPTLLFVGATQWLGLYVASFVLIAGFMRVIGRIALWSSVLTAFVFTALMFVTFEIAFSVLMPKGPLEAAFGY